MAYREARLAVCLVGLGAIGQAVLKACGAQLPLRWTLIDGDTVEPRNLGRQVLCAEEHVGRYKVEVTWEYLDCRGMHAEPNNSFLDAGNAHRLLDGHDVVIDATDDLHARFLLDATCARLALPLISAAVHADHGQVVLLHAPGPGLRDIFSGRPGPDQDGCDMRQVSVQLLRHVAELVMDRLKELLDNDRSHAGQIELVNDQGRAISIDARSLQPAE